MLWSFGARTLGPKAFLLLVSAIFNVRLAFVYLEFFHSDWCYNIVVYNKYLWKTYCKMDITQNGIYLYLQQTKQKQQP